MASVKIAIVGEAWGRHEAAARAPFMGPTGWYLNRLCEEAELIPKGSIQTINRNPRRRDEVYANAGIRLTNVLNTQPPGNKIEALCGERWGTRPAIRPGKYLRPEFSYQLDRCHNEITEWKPNLILGVGATALWFFTGDLRITKQRGTVTGTGYGKFLPTFHPSYLMQGQEHLRPVVLFDFIKAKRQAEFPEVRRPERFIHIVESLEDIDYGIREMLNAERISIDIETREDIITCIGFSWTPQHAMVIPFLDYRKPNNAYWSDNEEPHVWRLVQAACSLSAPKVFQNGLYDLHFLWRRYGITVTNCRDDTMLLHHAIQPEVQKGLGFLGSIYTDEPAWKLMRARGKSTVKREDE